MKYQKIKKYKYRVYEAEVRQTKMIGCDFSHDLFALDEFGILTIFEGYLWDGVSGPTWDSKNTHTAGLIHDALYQAIRLELLPQFYKYSIDTLFHTILLEKGMSKFRAGYYHKAVHMFGASSCVPGDTHIPEVLIA